MRRMRWALVAVAGLALGPGGIPAQATDPADSLYRAAREVLNARRYEEAARRFAELRERHSRSQYAADAYYFEAMALYRAGGAARLDRARRLLEEQLRAHQEAATAEDARALHVRIQSAMARHGDLQAAQAVTRSATAACEEEDQGVRLMALSALMQMDADQAVPILREVLRERGECSTELRRQAVFLLAQQMSEETADVFLDLAHRNPDPDPEVRRAAIFWLAQVQSDEAAEALISILRARDTPRDLQQEVLHALGQQSSARAAEAMRDFAGDPGAPAELRANAVFWLGQHPSAESRAWLLERAQDPGEPLEVRRQALFAAGEAGLGARQALEIYRDAEDREIKEQALFILTHDREDREGALDALMEIARTEEDPQLREQVIFWLAQSKDPRVTGFLLQVIRGG